MNQQDLCTFVSMYPSSIYLSTERYLFLKNWLLGLWMLATPTSVVQASMVETQGGLQS